MGQARISRTWGVVFVVLVCSVSGSGETIYVDNHASGLNDGTGWVNAYHYLQDGLVMASVGDEIRVTLVMLPLADLYPAAELRIRRSPARGERYLRTALAVNDHLHAAKYRMLLDYR